MQVQKELETESEIIICDLRKEKNVFNLYDKVKNQNIDILVNNAGFRLFGTFDETDIDKELEMVKKIIRIYKCIMSWSS